MANNLFFLSIAKAETMLIYLYIFHNDLNSIGTYFWMFSVALEKFQNFPTVLAPNLLFPEYTKRVTVSNTA